MNLEIADQILTRLAQEGVRTICLCPGARNAPFVKLLSEKPGFDVLSFFDERSAGFFALGRARRDCRPVVVCTTSGTAVSELLSSVIEAYYSNVPIVVLSADRPKRLRKTGAPQAIEQYEIFDKHVEKVWDISIGESIQFQVSRKKPTHLNVCFDEPLLGSFTSQEARYQIQGLNDVREEAFSLQKTPWKSGAKTLVVLGALSSKQRPVVEKALSETQLPIFAESLSGLCGSELLAHQLLGAGEKLISQMLKSGEVESVLRIGDVPVGRYWRDLDQMDLPVLSLSDKAFAGTERSELIETDLMKLDLKELKLQSWDWASWQQKDRQYSKKIHNLINKYPQSEVAFFKKLSEFIQGEDQIYVGNSLPIRNWDLIRSGHNNVFASRGVNGIDGQLSTAIGLHEFHQKTWALLGDLTTLYDFSGFWLSPLLKEQGAAFNLVTINNRGGQIFSRIFKEPLFRNEHELEFSKLAEMWGWEYYKNFEKKISDRGLNFIEVEPDLEQSQKFWEEYDHLWVS